ncbi:hypothetical protein Pst134EA_017505 [Puccinia striiformis f. sp. tritici]|uniref:hypothetical protein n=1 Tax=Puccinia striiformis f. sp. tritici TaxID=168172 RepID=UPI002008DC28|nr:hypothetical protein Pst134EA_017505 [Puccinia striiformis f. sp. tritici]KAH9461197.1 hypothetical protein Pst134EA_017505 [Puccinia striiformis f. sp. tritici]
MVGSLMFISPVGVSISLAKIRYHSHDLCPSASDSSIDLSIYLTNNRTILIWWATNALKNPSALDFLVALFSTSSSFDPFLIMF